MRGRHVQEGDLVGPLSVIASSQLHRVSGILEALEVDTFDDTAVVDVKAGDNADGHAHD